MNKVSLCCTSVLVSLALSGCAQQPKIDAQAQAELNNQSVMALNWFQQSGEYQALAYQAFSTATMAFDKTQSLDGKPKAVVVDIDETMVDNSAYSAWQVKANKPFADNTWSQWTAAKQAAAVPGAVTFANYVNSHGGTIFYVSNRKQSEYSATEENMKRLGFTGISDKTMLLSTGTSNKQARFDAIKAAGYNIVMYVGDNLNDFTSATYRTDNAQRRAFVNQNHDRFGTQYIILPNPMYGDWERGLAPDYNSLTPKQQLQARDVNLRAWDGK